MLAGVAVSTAGRQDLPVGTANLPDLYCRSGTVRNVDFEAGDFTFDDVGVDFCKNSLQCAAALSKIDRNVASCLGRARRKRYDYD